MDVDQKVKVTKQEECPLVPEIKPNLNETVSLIEIFFFGDRPQRAARIDS